jgi:hypothetical protein
MDNGRSLQLAVWQRMTSAQRLEQGARMTACVLAAWESRLRRQHPQANAEEMRAVRLAECMKLSALRAAP